MDRLRLLLRTLDDAALLLILAACWLIAFFQPPPDQMLAYTTTPTMLTLATAGRILSGLGAILVLVIWIFRPALRPGLRWRDLTLLLLLGVVVFQAVRAPIPYLGMLDLLETLQLVALFLIALHLCFRRPQPLFLVIVLVLALLALLDVDPRGRAPGSVPLDAARLGPLTLLMILAVLPWFAVRQIHPLRIYYGWFVVGGILAVLFLDALGIWPADGAWVQRFDRAFPVETRQFLERAVPRAWLTGLGPDHYAPLFRAYVPEPFADQAASLPGAAVLFVERGLPGLAAFLLFGVAMLWRRRPGPWGVAHGDVLEMAQPLRFVAVYVFYLYLATPALRSPFGHVLLWSLLGVVRAWSSRHPPAAVALVTGEPLPVPEVSLPVAETKPWSTGQLIALVGTVLLAVALTVFHAAPWISDSFRRRPAILPEHPPSNGRTLQRPPLPLHDPRFLKRLEAAQFWWPVDPRIYYMKAVHHRAKHDAGLQLSTDEISAITTAYRQMVRYNPYDPMSHQQLARWYDVLGQRDRAIEAIQRGLTYAPASYDLPYLLSTVYRDMGKLEQAIRVLEEGWYVRRLPVLLTLAHLYLRQGNRSQAEYYLQLARQIDPRNKVVLEMLKALKGGS